MSNVSVNFILTQSNETIQKNILKALKPDVDKYFESVFNTIKNQLSNIVIEAIKASPEYDSLLNGNLKAEFGLPDSSARVNNILDFWKNINFSYKKVAVKGGALEAGFTLNMIRSDYSDVFSLESASFTTEKGSTLNWLEWLLLFGKKTIIKDYTVVLGPSRRSRTGMALMRGVKSGKWSVPTEFAGTQNNNWITRSIDSVDDQVHSLLLNSLKGAV